jgi:hypothetical protein
MVAPRTDRTGRFRPTRTAGLIVALFFILTLVFTYPLWVRPGDTVMWHGSDTELFAWTLSWDLHALTHAPWAIFDANIYYPQRHTLAYSENLIGSAVLAAPALLLTHNPVVAINVVSLLTTFLCGIGAYVLARRVGASPRGAVLAGMVFAFGVPRFFRMGQLHLAAVQWVPFGLAAWHAYLDEGRRRDLRAAAGFFTLQALSSGHGTVFLLVAMVGLFAYRLVRGQPFAILRRLRDLGVVGALLLLPTALVLVEYRMVQHEMGLTRTLDDWVRTNGASFFASPSHVDTYIHGRLPGRLDPPQADLFPGYLPLLLAPFAFFGKRRAAGAPAGRATAGNQPSGRQAGSDAPFYGLLALGSLWLALPLERPYGLWPLLYWLPGLNFIRVPSRFTILTMLALAVLAGLGFERLARRLDGRRATAFAVVVGLLLAVEFAAMPLQPAHYRVEIPAVDRWLAGVRKPFVVAEVPVPDPNGDGVVFERRQSTYMLHSIAHMQKTVHGYSGTRPPLHDQLYAQLAHFPDDEGLASLERLGVTYVVVHTDLYEPGEWPRVEERIARFADRLRLDQIVGTGRIYSVVQRRPAAGR